jgi:hypothetical protein
MWKQLLLKVRISRKGYLTAFWISVAIISTGCNARGEDVFKALLGFVLLPIVGGLIISICYFVALKSALHAGSVIGLLLATIIEITVPASVQFALIGGILGISVDKITTKAAADLPTTILDRLSSVVLRLADSIRNVSAGADYPASIRSVRRGVWAATLAILTVLLLARSADQIGLTGTAIYDALWTSRPHLTMPN